MQSYTDGNLLQIIELAHTLRQEQLFIQNEQSTFENLIESLSRNSSAVAEIAWICAQQRQNLNDLIISRPDTGPSMCCQRANRLENTRFVDAYKAKSLKYQHVVAYTELFYYLHRSPYLLAQCLSAVDRIPKMTSDTLNSVVHTIATGLYGNAIHSKDIEMILKLLRELMAQIVVTENPRRMLRSGSSAFSRLYHQLHESLFSAKIFLTAALHSPVMKVLIGSETMLDMDPNKAIMNLTNKERLRRFGEENTPEYDENVRKYREETINNLFYLANNFIENLSQNWSLFPTTLRWLVRTMCHLLKQAHVADKDINEILTDLVFTNFICPAVVSPDIFGISDAPVSEQARANLIQIGQILQRMALLKYADIDPKYSEIYRKFESNPVAELLEQLLINDNDLSIGVVAIRSQQGDFERSHILITQNDLNTFIDFLRNVLENDELNISGDDRRKLGKILDQLPDKFETILNGECVNSSPVHAAADGTNNRTKQSLINLGKTTKNKLAKTMSLNISNSFETEDLTGLGHSHGHQNGSENGHNGVNNHNGMNFNNNHYGLHEENDHVLAFPISIGDENKFQLLTEADVLKMNSIGEEMPVDPIVLTEENIEKLEKVEEAYDGLSDVLRPSHNKAGRFSVSHDDASIGNSDNLEAVSEAPSNHSVTSSLELEENDQNDNLSDMISANVSGRGTPNISGRDTPSSQVTEGENLTNQIPTPQMAKIINKTRSDIEDKFCKFEIKKLIEVDETISIISDTWSTDVLASDSETVDAIERDRNFSTPLIPSAVVLPGDNNFDALSSARGGQMRGSFLDTSETRSESAWSTDVLASDSEKLAEVDTDDNLSITVKSEGDNSQDQEANGRPNNAPDSPYFAPRSSNSSFRTPDSPGFDRPNEPSFVYDNSSTPAVSLARSSTRTGDNSFQQNYKSTSERVSFLTAPTGGGGSSRMRRQNSAESSISNQSLNLDDCYGQKVKVEKPNKDLIDFCDFQEDGATGGDNKTDVDMENFPSVYDQFSEESVIHRRQSSEQRNATFDGRRNGIMEFKPNSHLNPRRQQSLNYENHEIISKNTNKRMTIANADIPMTDDFKNQQNALDEILLIQRTQELNLHRTANNTSPKESVLGNGPKPSKSTGAIPKSISFDSSADKSERNSQIRRITEQNLRVSNGSGSGSGSGFFHKIKQGFKSRRGNKGRLSQDEFTTRNISFVVNGNLDNAECEMNGRSPGRGNDNGYGELSEDILAKYRRKVSTSSETTNSESTGGSCSVNRKNSSDIDTRLATGNLTDKAFTFLNAKKKIRKVLSTTDLHTGDFRHTTYSNASPLLIYLQIQLAQAINLHNFQQISNVSEAIRCLNTLDRVQHQKLIKELQSDILKRQSYLQYLMRYRQNLLSIMKNIEQFEDRLRRERKMCNRHLIAVCVRMFLEKREPTITKFQDEFCSLTVVDEKTDLLDEFMGKLMDDLKMDGIVFGMADWQLCDARIAIERILLQRLYRHVMFPNDDGDISRDEVLHNHIRKLKQIITPSHTALRIPEEYLMEAPWPFAQQQISYISAYKTPSEKLQCVVRCISSIINLLQIGCDRIPAADDLLPVLIYVIIKANPPYLLSTIQYVSCFIGDKLDGEEQFNWTQFCSAVQFIKTMDYLD